jgi:hypothetical protein
MQMRSCRTEHADVPAAPSRRYLATGRLILMLASVALFGCRNISEPIAPPETRIKPKGPSHDVYGCTLGTTYCARIDAAITYLENYGGNCQGAASQARSRFVSTTPGIGFYETNDPAYYAKTYVTPNTNPSNYSADQVTNVNIQKIDAAGWGGAQTLGSILAHEEYHHYGYGPFHSQWDEYWQAPGPPPPACDLAQFQWPS